MPCKLYFFMLFCFVFFVCLFVFVVVFEGRVLYKFLTMCQAPFHLKPFFCLVSSFRKKLTKASSWKFNHYNEYSKKSNQSQKLLRLAIFSWRSPKKMLDLLKDTHNSTPPGSMLCQVWKSYAKQWWPEMTKQTCNQH